MNLEIGNKISPFETMHVKTEETFDTYRADEVFCEHCGSVFADHYTLKKHIDLEHIDNHVCPTCQISFSTKAELTRHQRHDHNQEKPFVCEICQSAHKFEYKLFQHMQQVHEKIRPYKCDICPSAFGRINGLNKHKRYVHDKEKNFACPHCERKMSRKDDLNIHIRVVHEKTKPYSCDQCEFVTSTISNLNTHKHAMHSNLKAELPCPDCGKLFKTKNKVRAHFQQVHNPIKPFKCDQCEYSSLTNSKLKKHQYIMHTNLTPQIPCTECDKLFKTKDTFRSHFKNVHGNAKRKMTKIKVKQADDSSQPDETTDVSLDNTHEAPMDIDNEMNLLGDLVNDYDMNEEFGETLEHPRKIKYPKKMPKSSTKKRSASHPEIKVEILSQSELEDSSFDSCNNARQNSRRKKSSASRASTAESSSNMLEIYSSSSTKEPITNRQWLQIEKFIIDQLTSEISAGAVSAINVKISHSGYDHNKRRGFIQAKDSQSVNWYKDKISQFILDGMSFRAWSEHEVAEFYNLRLTVPSKLDSIPESQVLPLLVSFNPELDTFKLKIDAHKVVDNVGRYFFLEASTEAFEYIEERNWKLDYLMGAVDIINTDKSND